MTWSARMTTVKTYGDAMAQKMGWIKITSFVESKDTVQRVYRYSERVINYSHSRNPTCAPARMHGQIRAPREPPN
jgi:hypothetical protein